MAFEKIGTGYLGRNQYKEDGDNKPEYKGKLSIEVGGQKVEVDLGAWIKEKDGRKFFSLSASADVKATPAPAAADGEEIPF